MLAMSGEEDRLEGDADQKSRALVLAETAELPGRRAFVLDRLTEQERRYVISQCEPRLAKRHSTIFRQGDVQKGIYIIQSGGDRVFYAPKSGRESTRAYWFAGQLIWGPDVFEHNKNMCSAVAVKDTSLLLMPSGRLRNLCGRIPNLAIGLIEAMVFKGRCYSTLTQMLGTRSANDRMLRVLIMLAEMYGSQEGNEINIKVPITHEEIAHMVGATRQWVTKGLKELYAEGVVESGRGKLRIRNFDDLIKRAGLSCDS